MDVIIFLVNGCDGIIVVDEEVVKILYKFKKFVVLVVNKVDNFEMRELIYDFYVLGYGELFLILGMYGLGLGDLLDEVVKYFLKEKDEDYGEEVIKFLLIGCFNVGKFLLVNVFLGEDCVIVSDFVGMICDVIDIKFIKED